MIIKSIKPPRDPRHSVLCLFSRSYTLDNWFGNFMKLSLEPESTELLFIVDSRDKAIHQKVFNFASLFNSFNGVTLIDTQTEATRNDKMTMEEMGLRRDRIANLYNLAGEHLSYSDTLLVIEDDTIFTNEDYMKLKLIYRLGYATGIQVGRHGLPVLGIWRTDNCLEPTIMETAPFLEEGIIDVDGGGLFFCLTNTREFKHYNFHWTDECLSVDVLYVMYLRCNRYKCIADYSIQLGHMTQQGIIYPSELTKTARWELINNHWRVESIK